MSVQTNVSAETISLTREMLKNYLETDIQWLSRAVIRLYEANQAGRLKNLVLTPNADPKLNMPTRFEFAYNHIKEGRALNPFDFDLMSKIATQECCLDYLFKCIIKKDSQSEEQET